MILNLPVTGRYQLRFVPDDVEAQPLNISILLTIPFAPSQRTRWVFFGDGLTDDGTGLQGILGAEYLAWNIGQPYVGGRLSNGPTWAEYITDSLLNGAVRLNFAVGMSQTL